MAAGVTVSRTLSQVSVRAMMLNVLEVMYWEIISMLELRDLQLMRQAVIELLLFVVSHVDLSCLLSFLMYSLNDSVQSVSWSSVGVSGFDFQSVLFLSRDNLSSYVFVLRLRGHL